MPELWKVTQVLSINFALYEIHVRYDNLYDNVNTYVQTLKIYFADILSLASQ